MVVVVFFLSFFTETLKDRYLRSSTSQERGRLLKYSVRFFSVYSSLTISPTLSIEAPHL